ncbi:MAG TPA: hypothetical protein PLL88_11115 [Anaerolineaceae bacterium]|nr:hypothetical protein [Anaerolineaceae bacterium]
MSKAGRKLVLHEYLSRVALFLILFCVSGNWGWLGACILIPIAMRANPFFSSTVRIQSERGQTVVGQEPLIIMTTRIAGGMT